MQKKILFLITAILIFAIAITANAQSQTFTCFQKNYGEGKGWETANFKVTIDVDNLKISIHDPKLQEFIRFSSTVYTVDEKTTLFIGKDQSGLSVKVFVALTSPPTLTVLYLNTSIGQIYKLR